MKPSERIQEIECAIRRESFPTSLFSKALKRKEVVYHIQYLAIMQYLDEQAKESSS